MPDKATLLFSFEGKIPTTRILAAICKECPAFGVDCRNKDFKIDPGPNSGEHVYYPNGTPIGVHTVCWIKVDKP